MSTHIVASAPRIAETLGNAAPDESRERLAAIARMYYLDGLGQHEISGIVGLSRSQVSRLLTRARDLGIVRISVEEFDPRDRDLEAQLVNRFSAQGLRQAIVTRTTERADQGVRAATGYFAAPAVSALIERGMAVGLAGGRTLAEVVRHVQPLPGVRGVTAVQLMGNIGPTASDIDAVELCRTVALRFDGSYYTVNAPAFVQDRAARDLFLAHEHIRAVTQLYSTLQLALVGIGTLDESAFVDRGAITPEERTRLGAVGAVGEICGRFFDAQGRECQSDYHDRVVSIDLDTLRRCPNVVAVTNGAPRAQAVRAALDGGLISSLVIDESGARALLADYRRT